MVLTGQPSSTGGYHVETGYAIALMKTVGVVGPQRNFFHSLCGQFDTWEDCICLWEDSIRLWEGIREEGKR